MKRIDVGFKLFKHLCREEIIDEHCPYEIDSILPDQDIDTYRFLDGCTERGCRGITCEECWGITVMGYKIQSLDLKTPIQVRTGDYRREWTDAKIVHVSMEDVGEDEDEKVIKGLSFSVEFGEGLTQRVSDAFGWGSEDWRYKEKCCEQCRWDSIEGGVPYGATTAALPEGHVCDCPYMDENVEGPYDETNGGRDCPFHEFANMSQGIIRLNGGRGWIIE